jgi:hypothetical protein
MTHRDFKSIAPIGNPDRFNADNVNFTSSCDTNAQVDGDRKENAGLKITCILPTSSTHSYNVSNLQFREFRIGHDVKPFHDNTYAPYAAFGTDIAYTGRLQPNAENRN